jgi:hypothetical protein
LRVTICLSPQSVTYFWIRKLPSNTCSCLV